MTRAGGSQVFFNVIAHWNAEKLIHDARASATVMEAVMLDSFEAILKPLDDIGVGIGELVNEVEGLTLEMGQASIEFRKFYGDVDDSVASLETMEDTLRSLGHQYAISGSESLIAGARASQMAALVGKANISILAEQAFILAEISDLSAEESQKAIISLQQQTDMLLHNNDAIFLNLSLTEQQTVLRENGAKALDTLNTVANRSVATEGQIIKTMSSFASQAALVNEEFEAMAAQSAVLIEAGEDAGRAGRALRMMYARLGGDIAGAREEMESYGLQVTDSEGNMKSLTDIMDQLRVRGWDKSNQATKQAIAQTVAGNRHYVRFIKLMDGFTRSQELAAAAISATNDGAKEQADVALARLSKSYEKAQIRADNLRVELGERMLPAMVANEEATNRFRVSVIDLVDTMGGKGGILGRGMATAKFARGFMEANIAMRGLAIGIGTYKAVQSSLRQLLIANENLHSRQATHLEYGKKASVAQLEVQKKIRYNQQVLNRYSQDRKRTEQDILNLQRLMAPDLAKQKMLWEEINIATQKSSVLNRENYNLTRINRDMTNGRATYLNQIIGMGDLDLQRNRELWNVVKGVKNSTVQRVQSISAAAKLQTVSEAIGYKELLNLKLLNEEQTLQIAGLNRIKEFHDINNALSASGMAKTATFNNETRNVVNNLITQKRQAIQEEINFLELKEFMTVNDKARVSELIIEEQQYADIKLNNARTAGELTSKELALIRQLRKEKIGDAMKSDTLIQLATKGQVEFNRVIKDAENVRRFLIDAINDEWIANDKLARLLKKNEHLFTKQNDLARLHEMAMKGEIKSTKQLIKYEGMLSMETKGLNKWYDKQVTSGKAQVATLNMTAERMKAMTMGTNAAGMAMGTFLGTQRAATAAMILFNVQMVAGIGNTIKQITNNDKLNASQKRNIIMWGVIGTAAIAAIAYGVAGSMEKAKKETERLNSELQKSVELFDYLSAGNSGDLISEGLQAAIQLQTPDLAALRASPDLARATYAEILQAQKDFAGALSTAQKKELDASAIMLSDIIGGQSHQSGEEGWIPQYYRDDLAIVKKELTDFGSAALATWLSPSRKETKKELKEAFGTIVPKDAMKVALAQLESGVALSEQQLKILSKYYTDFDMDMLIDINSRYGASLDAAARSVTWNKEKAEEFDSSLTKTSESIQNLTGDLYNFSDAKEELFFGGKYGNVTGSLYKQVVTQGVGTLYNKNEVIMSNNFHGFFNEETAAERIIAILDAHINSV